MKIIVAGASGYIGGTLVNRLIKNGERPVCLARNITALREKFPENTVDFIAGDTLQPQTLDVALQGADVLVHAAFMTANLKQNGANRYFDVNVRGTQNLIEAAQRQGVSRIIAVSGLGTKEDKQGTYMQGRYLAEQAIQQSGLGWAILQPSIVFGPHSAFIAGLAKLVQQVPFVTPMAGSGKETFQPIWVEDVAACLDILIHDASRDDKRYPVGGPEIISYSQILDIIMASLHKKKLKVPAPSFLMKPAAGMLEILLPNPPITSAALELFAFPNTTELNSVQHEFGFTPQSLRQYTQEHGVW